MSEPSTEPRNEPQIPKAPRVPLFDREPFQDESVARVLTRLLPTFSLTTAVMVALLLLHSCVAGCAPQPTPAEPSVREGYSQASIVTLLKVERADPLLDPGNVQRYTDRYVPACNAFAVVRDGRTQLVTAAHCVPAMAGLGSELRYYAPDGWGHGHAILVERDIERDQAFLDATEPDMLEPLTVAREPVLGETVVSFAPYYGGIRSAGRVTAWLTMTPNGAWYETDQTIVKGWSGSPALDYRGRVWGVVCKCPLDGDDCSPGHTYVSALR